MIRFGIKMVYLQQYRTIFTDICMEKTLILQNPHWEGKAYAGLYRRQLMDNLLQKKTLPHVQILTGVRRCGKSTLFKLLINDLRRCAQFLVLPKGKQTLGTQMLLRG